MRAATRFTADLESLGALDTTAGVEVQLYGSLAATGAGHGSPVTGITSWSRTRVCMCVPQTRPRRMISTLRNRWVLGGCSRVRGYGMAGTITTHHTNMNRDDE